MKINELEKELNISRANIRFYEKEGLLNPARKENGYREYSDRDIADLKKIIVYRKLGISVTDIKKILNDELELQQAVSESIVNLQKEIEKLNGSIRLCKEIQNDNADNKTFDEAHYWNEINSTETSENKFVDICKDYIDFEKPVFESITRYFLCIDYKKIQKKHGVWWLVFIILAICTVRGIASMVWGNETFWYGFLYPFVIFAIISAILLPVFLLKNRHPNIAANYMSIIYIIFVVLIVLVVIAVILLFLFAICKKIFNF